MSFPYHASRTNDAAPTSGIPQTMDTLETHTSSIDGTTNQETIGPPIENVCCIIQDLSSTQHPHQINPLGREVTLLSGVMLNVGVIIGSGIFSVPGVMLKSVGSVGLLLTLWIVEPLITLGAYTVVCYSRRKLTMFKLLYSHLRNLPACFRIVQEERLFT